MGGKAWALGLGLTGVLMLFLVWWVFRPAGGDPGSVPSEKSNGPENFSWKTENSDGRKDQGEELPGKMELAHRPDPVLQTALQGLWERLQAKPDRETVRRLLREFAQKAFASNPDAAAATLLEFLRKGGDLPTGLDFVVGEAGLDEWPSLRAFLLDLLGKIDPDTASRYVLEVVIPAKNSTVEYAVSLQILWNHGGAEKPTRELTQAWLGLLQKPDWSARPDAAWMESLDFASRIPDTIPAFLGASSPWLAKPGEAAGKAESTEMVLERMMIRHPQETMKTVLENPQWMNEGRGPALRATVFARVDATDSGQVQYLRTYLQRLDPSGKEAAVFYQAFPCHNYGVAPGLSGPADIPGAGELQKRLQADVALLEAWRRDPSLAGHRAWLDQAELRVKATLGPGFREK